METKKELITGMFEIRWCVTCNAFYVKCPRCGNNTCNAGYGEDGKCPVCPLAYDVMYAISKNEDAEQKVEKLLFANGGTKDSEGDMFKELGLISKNEN
jgi:hypothetical protein